MNKFLLIILLSLTGCTNIQPKYDIKQTDFHLTVVPNSEEFISKTPNIMGEAVINFKDKTCKITLRKYPQCLQHEVRHCIEGNWHEGRESLDDCHN